jgi:chromosomal replication initiator protein
MSVTSSAIIPNPWVRILDALEKKVNRHSYDTWLKPTRYSHADNGILFVRVPTAEFRTVGDKYADLIQEAIDNLGLEYQDVKFVTAEDDPSNTPIRHNGGLSMGTAGAQAAASPSFQTQARFD